MISLVNGKDRMDCHDEDRASSDNIQAKIGHWGCQAPPESQNL